MKTTFVTLLLMITALFAMGICSCSTDYAVATPGFYKPAPPSDPSAEFGVFIKRGEKLNREQEVKYQK